MRALPLVPSRKDKTMRMNKLIAGSVVGLILIGAVSPATSLPLASNGAVVKQMPTATMTDVRWRRGYGWGVGLGVLGLGIAAGAYPYYGGYGPYYPGPYYPGPYYPGPYYPAPAYYGGPGYAGPPNGDAVGYCMQRFRSFDPRSGTYLGNDGYRHPCP
jgi:BA14K-like protein